jgi:sugar diacid utilization regulator
MSGLPDGEQADALGAGEHSPAVAVRQLQELVELARSAREESLSAVLAAVAKAVRETSGFNAVVVNLYRPAWDDYAVVLVLASSEAEAALLDTTMPAAILKQLIGTQRADIPGTFFLPGDGTNWDDVPASFVPNLASSDNANAWQAEDSVLALLTDSQAEPLGFISVDEPAHSRRPSIDDLRLLRAICANAEQALESARHHREADAAGAVSARLLIASGRLDGGDSATAVDRILSEEITEHLGFERVAIYLRSADGTLALSCSAGWDARDPLTLSVDAKDLARLLADTSERAGAWLLPAADLFGPVLEGSRSRRNGRGPHGWSEHCVVVPVRDEADRVDRLVVVEDPIDHQLPSDRQLHPIGVLADRAGAALTNLRMRAIQSEMLGLVLARRDAEALTGALAEMIQAPVAVLDWIGQPIAEAAYDDRQVRIPDRDALVRSASGLEPQNDADPLVRALELGDRNEGYIVVDPSGRGGVVREMAVEQAVTSFALHLAMLANAEEIEHRIRGSLIDQLLGGDPLDTEAITRITHRLGHDVSSLAAAVAVQPLIAADAQSRLSAFTYLARSVRAATAAAGCVAIIAPHANLLLALISEPTGGCRELGRRIVAQARADSRIEVLVGVSRPVDDPTGLAAAIREAQQTLRVVQTMPALAPVALAAELDLRHLVLTAPRSAEMESAARRLLGTLLDVGTRNRELLQTLRVYLDAVGQLQTTAARLDIHINTLRHRLARIESELSVDLRDARTRVDLYLALELLAGGHGPAAQRTDG